MSRSSDFAKAKQSNPNLAYADFIKTWVDPNAKKDTGGTSQDPVSSGRADLDRKKKATEPKQEPTKPVSSGRADLDRIAAEKAAKQAAAKKEMDDRKAASEAQGKTEYQKWKAGEISTEQYHSGVKSNSAQNRANELARVGGFTAGVQNKYQAAGGEQPTKATPGEGEEWTDEDYLKAEVSYQQQLAGWWKKVGEDSAADVAGVIELTQNQMAQSADYQKKVDDLIINLNKTDPAMGSAMTDVFAEVDRENLTPDVMGQLQVLAESGITPAQFKEKATKLISASVQSEGLKIAGVDTSNGTFNMGNGVEFEMNSDGTPNFSLGSIPENASASDLLALEYAIDTQVSNAGLKQELQQLINYSKEVIRTQETAKEEINYVFGDARNKLDESKLAAMNEAKYNQMRLQMEKANNAQDIMDAEAQMEGYLKAQLEAWGADSSAGALTVMQKNKLKFTQQLTRSNQAYDLELSRVSDKITEAEMAYTNRSVELAHQEYIANKKQDDSYLTSLDKILEGTSKAYSNRDLKILQANKNYLGGVRQINSAKEEAEAEAFKDTRDFNFKLMKEYSDNSGYQYEMLSDGSLRMILNTDGTPALTLASERAGRLGSGGGAKKSETDKMFEKLNNSYTTVEGKKQYIADTVLDAVSSDDAFDEIRTQVSRNYSDTELYEWISDLRVGNVGAGLVSSLQATSALGNR